MASLGSDERAVSPVVGKTLAAGIALLYVAGMGAVLFGGVVPDYRTASGAEVGERVLATAAGNVEAAVPAVDGTVDSETTVELPATIHSSGYRLVLSNRTLELVHPESGIDGKARLSLPKNVTALDGTYHSGDDLVIRIEGPATNRTLSIEEGR